MVEPVGKIWLTSRYYLNYLFLFLFLSVTKTLSILCNSYDYFWNSEQKSTLVLLQLKIQSTHRFSHHAILAKWLAVQMSLCQEDIYNNVVLSQHWQKITIRIIFLGFSTNGIFVIIISNIQSDYPIFKPVNNIKWISTLKVKHVPVFANFLLSPLPKQAVHNW